MKTTTAGTAGRSQFWLVFFILSAVLLLLFYKAILPGHVLFSNDGPLGSQMAEAHRMPEMFKGGWEDLNSVGFRNTGALPDMTYSLLCLLGPVWYSKLYAPLSLLVLGLGAWCFFRQLGLARPACVLGSLAAALNSGFFSAACWGVAAHTICVGMVFFSLAALVDTSSRWRWLRVGVGGAALGVAVCEGADIGAIFSLYVAAFIVYLAWTTQGHTVRALAVGVGRVVLVAALAALVAAQVIDVLVGTQIKGVAGMQQDTQTKEERWDWATQWSLPKREALGYIIPGLFGYRMDTPGGGVYWGAMGRDPAWYRYWANGGQGPEPQGGKRFSGGGIYAGVLVVVVAFWAALQGFRKKDSVFAEPTRRLLWFWTGAAVLSLLLAFGRFAPFYQLFYALPYFSTIRNPGKFAHIVSWAVLVLFAYGLDGLWRRYIEGQTIDNAGFKGTVRAWWQRVRGFDRRWTQWSLAALATCLLGGLIYASSRKELVEYLQKVDFDAATAGSIASFSYGQVGWFLATLAASIALITLILSGVFRGPRGKVAAVLMGLFLVLDLGRANQPWIIPWDYPHKYATNPVIDMLRQKAYAQRVAILPRWFTNIFRLPPQLATQEGIINYLYGIEWSQHLFLYYNIQSLDVIQMPRMPQDLLAFDMAFNPRSEAQLSRVGRKWQLTNTRYLIGAADFLQVLNQYIDPAQHSFRYKERFTIAPKPGYPNSNNAADWTAVPETNGPFAVFEFAAALPRAQLYSAWELEAGEAAAASEVRTNTLQPGDLELLRAAGTNNFVTLKRLSSPSFDPARTVIVAPSGQNPLPGTNSAAAPGKVEITSYAPKHIVLKAEATAPSVLLLNDRYDPIWQVLVDGKPETLLRCNFFMRGVFLTPGSHEVQFRFQPPLGSLYVSLVGVGFGILLCGLLLVVTRSSGQPLSEVGPDKEERKNPKRP
ncbi:MAG TPA: hypothetical protein VJA21_16280 [Verrucomicrobiae bacterium]